MKKTVVAFMAVAILATMIPFALADNPEGWPPCGTPGRTPGYWKHQIKVRYGLTNGEYSNYFDDVKMNDAFMDAILEWVIANNDQGATSWEQILERLEARGPGSEAIRNGMNWWMNYGAYLDPENLI